jgi:long-chain acyl-CoA synthetase
MATVLHRLEDWFHSTPKAVAQRHREDDRWRDITVEDFRERVLALALFLESRGVSSDAVGVVFGPNSPAWVHADLATLLLGARSAGIYPNSAPKDISHILRHTEAQVLSVANAEFYGKVKSAFGADPSVKVLLALDNDTSIHPSAVALSDAIDQGRALFRDRGADFEMARFLGRIDPMAGAFLIYTSGTTGTPKGALLSHDNLVFTSDRIAEVWKLPREKGSMFSFLPLCHIAEKLQSIGVGLSLRYPISYCSKFERLAEELPEVQPEVLLCVPRLWEKMKEGVERKLAQAPEPRRRLAEWAMRTGREALEARLAGRGPGLALTAQAALAEKLVLRKVRRALGLEGARVVASGAAALNAEVARWFRGLGLEILEDYGQTETTGVVSVTLPGMDCAGTVGKPVDGMDFRLADDGEIQTRGRHVFVGYYKDEAATLAVLKDGWCATGDLATFNERGLLELRGRKKEILKTSGGKMVAPMPIEEKLKASPWISQACVVGDGRKYLGVLLTLSETVLAELKVRGVTWDSSAVTIDSPEVQKEIQAVLDSINSDLASYEQLKRFAVLAREFSIESGELTPTLKMKRSVVEQNYRSVIDTMIPS